MHTERLKKLSCSVLVETSLLTRLRVQIPHEGKRKSWQAKEIQSKHEYYLCCMVLQMKQCEITFWVGLVINISCHTAMTLLTLISPLCTSFCCLSCLLLATVILGCSSRSSVFIDYSRLACVFITHASTVKRSKIHNTDNNNPVQSKQPLGELFTNNIASFHVLQDGNKGFPLKHLIYPTLLAFSISNIRGNPCVISSSVYSSSWMDLNSFSKHWMRGRRCCWKDVRRDSSHVCSVQGTPADRGHSSFPPSSREGRALLLFYLYWC